MIQKIVTISGTTYFYDKFNKRVRRVPNVHIEHTDITKDNEWRGNIHYTYDPKVDERWFVSFEDGKCFHTTYVVSIEEWDEDERAD